MQGKWKFYDIENDRILWLRRSLKKQSVVKRCQNIKQNQNQYIYPYLLRRYTISETAKENRGIRLKNLQEEDKEYLRKQNVDHHSDGVVNKTIKKDVRKYSTLFAGDNLDKSAEFISTCFNLILLNLNWIFKYILLCGYAFILDSLAHLNCFVCKLICSIFIQKIFMPIEIVNTTIR